MNRRSILMCLSALPFAAIAQTPDVGSLASELKNPLIGALTSQLGVTESQATGGIGSYLALAQEKLSKGDFDKIAGLIPGATKYIDQAKSLGALAGPLKNLTGLNNALAKLGISPEVAAQLVPMVTDYLSKAGGAGVQKLLTSALK